MDKVIKILKIVSIVAIVYEVKKKFQRRSRLREVNENSHEDEDGFFARSYQQIKEKDEEHFFKLTRMNVNSFNLLLSLIKNKLEKHSHRKPIDCESRLAITLIYLAHGCTPQILAWSFKVGISTVREIVYETCEIIYNELHIIYLSVPKTNEYKQIAVDFYNKSKLPNCVGAIDGKLIRIVCPRNSGSVYYNYKNYFSIILLAVCDSNYIFTFYKIGAAGHESDSAVFRNSEFGKKIISETLDLPEQQNLPGTNIKFPYYFIGDAAFPLKNNLMRPYPGRNLPRDKKTFNKRLSRARIFIENSFGILANRWRILHTSIYCNPTNVDKIISATMVLHNFLMLQKDDVYFTEDLVDREINGTLVPGSWREDENQLSNPSILFNRSSNMAFDLRNKLKDYLN